MEPRLSIIALGVKDLEVSRRFYRVTILSPGDCPADDPYRR